jgi:integrase
MRVRLKGINRVSKRLADGSHVTYYYAWKGGPRLSGKPGSPEFHASYNRAVADRTLTPSGTLQFVLNAYEQSADFTALAPRTQADYKKHIKAIEAEFGDFPIAALSDRGARADFLKWRDKLAHNSRRQADYAFTVLARSLSWAFDRGLVPGNPCEKPGRLYRSGRRENVWTDVDEAALKKHAPAHLWLAYMLALWTGQRQGDLIKLPWSAYDGTHIRLRQGKTGARVVIPVGAPLKALLDETPKRAVTILANAAGTSWTSNTFGTAWRRSCRKASISGLTFHDLRGTAVTRLALAGGTEAEIATITGHSLADIGAILDTHYLKRDAGLAESAIHKLESRTKLPTARPTGG